MRVHMCGCSQGSTPLRSLEEADADDLQHDFLNEGFLVGRQWRAA